MGIHVILIIQNNSCTFFNVYLAGIKSENLSFSFRSIYKVLIASDVRYFIIIKEKQFG